MYLKSTRFSDFQSLHPGSDCDVHYASGEEMGESSELSRLDVCMRPVDNDVPRNLPTWLPSMDGGLMA
jgi:hypothetical protein